MYTKSIESKLKKDIQNNVPIQTIHKNLVQELNYETEFKKNNLIFQFLLFDKIQKNYFSNVTMKNINKNELLKMLFFLNDTGKKFILDLNNLKIFGESKPTEQWKKCQGPCSQLIKQYLDLEVSSTVFMIRLFSYSFVKSPTSTNSEKVYFSYENENNEPLTGKWIDDKKYFKLISTYEGKPRLILGFGPSASGKTFWTKTIISLFKEKFQNFPEIFLSIDGGIAREVSIIYQIVIHQIKLSSFSGLKNLVNASIFTSLPNLFDSEKIKKKMIDYLKQNEPMSMYVPLTLGGCAMDCKKSYQPYLDITRDESWIGLLIYQHKIQEECNFKEGFQCKSTTVSGKQRQIQQGKKYSNSAYSFSMKNGMVHMNRSPFCSLEIHNSGGLKNSQSIIMEHPKNNDQYTLLQNEDTEIQKNNFYIISSKRKSKFLS